MSKNTNCLEGIKCPECGNEDSFRIVATTWVTVDDDGTSDPTDFEWDDYSPIICCRCPAGGCVIDFTVEEG